jgi:hypothetical protein
MPMEADEVPTLLMHGASSRLSFVKALKKRNVA